MISANPRRGSTRHEVKHGIRDIDPDPIRSIKNINMYVCYTLTEGPPCREISPGVGKCFVVIRCQGRVRRIKEMGVRNKFIKINHRHAMSPFVITAVQLSKHGKAFKLCHKLTLFPRELDKDVTQGRRPDSAPYKNVAVAKS